MEKACESKDKGAFIWCLQGAILHEVEQNCAELAKTDVKQAKGAFILYC